MNKNHIKSKTIYYNCGKRAVITYLIIMFTIGLACLKVLLINFDQNSAVSRISTSKTLVLGESRGIIYDCNMNRLVCEEYINVCAVKPTVDAVSALRAVVSGEEYIRAVEELSHGNPFIVYPDTIVKNDDIVNARIYNRYTRNQPAAHLIGYLGDENSNGISGIEFAYNDILTFYSGSIKARFFTNGAGRIMQGGSVETIDENYNSSGGVVLTIDKRFQIALESAMDQCKLNKGAAVMLDVRSGEIVAAASRPDFDPDRISDYVNDNDLALFNRLLGAYPVGSVFKPLVAASALEQGVDPAEEFECTGKISAEGVSFSCTKAHGLVNMATAIVYSCNCYFVDLINKIDYAQVIDLAASLGFGNNIEIADSIVTYSSNLPSASELEAAAARANFSFGQGSITATPLHIASLYSMLANSGEYNSPYLVKGISDEKGHFVATHNNRPPYKILSDKTANMISDYLELAVREGTGKNAAADSISVAGKTATAQSGNYVNGKERLITWFAGFFPFEQPRYVLVVMCEDGVSGSSDCAPVFSAAVKKVMEYEP